MSKMTVFDTDTGEPVGDVEIPDDVIEAAAKVEHWMREQGSGIQLHGLKLSDD